MFDGPPVWLWSLRSVDWSGILISPADATQFQHQFSATWVSFREKLLITELTPNDLPTDSVSTWFISGQSLSIAQFVNVLDVPVVRLILGEGRRPQSILKAPHIQWLSLSHTRVGGVTTSRATVGFSGLPHLTFPPDLKRTIGNVLKYSIRPRPCSPDLIDPHLSTSSLLPVSRIHLHVLYPTHFSHTGWGIRSLTDLELSSAFELPDYVEWNDEFATDIVPLQIPRAVIDTVVLTHLPMEPDHSTLLVSSPPISLAAETTLDDDSCWLPSLQRFLPGSWTNTPIADRAVKADGASVDFFPWHQRVRLVLPCPEHVLEIIERFGMRLWRRNIVRSFVAYLYSAYGPDWPTLLSAAGSCPTEPGPRIQRRDSRSFNVAAYKGVHEQQQQVKSARLTISSWTFAVAC